MSDAPVTGIVGSQNSAKATATTARNAGKGRLKSWGKWAAILLVSLVVLDAFVNWVRAPSKQDVGDGSKPASQMSQTQPTTHLQARWAGTSDGDLLPMEVWSEEAPVGVGCSVKFPFAEGNRVQYRYYSDKWEEYVAGASPNMSGFRVMILKEGMTSFPYSQRCS